MNDISPHLSTHATERFHTRVRSTLDRAGARRELERLVALGTITERAPAWLAERQLQRAERYLVVGDLALPLVFDGDRWIGVTCIARGGISDLARARRNGHRAARARAAASRRLGGRRPSSTRSKLRARELLASVAD